MRKVSHDFALYFLARQSQLFCPCKCKEEDLIILRFFCVFGTLAVFLFTFFKILILYQIFLYERDFINIIVRKVANMDRLLCF